MSILTSAWILAFAILVSLNSSKIYITAYIGYPGGLPYAAKPLSRKFMASVTNGAERLISTLLWEPNNRLQVAKVISSYSPQQLRVFSPGDVKIILSSCIEVGSPSIIKTILSNMHKAGMVNSEVMYVAVRLACKKKNAQMAYSLLNETARYRFPNDPDMLSSVAELLARNNDIYDSIRLVSRVHDGEFGTDLQCSLSTYEVIVDCTSRLEHKDLLIKASKLLAKHRRKLGTFNEDLLFQALRICSLDGDAVSAMEIFKLFDSSKGGGHVQSYALILSALVTNRGKSPPDIETSQLNSSTPLLGIIHNGTAMGESKMFPRAFELRGSGAPSRGIDTFTVELVARIIRSRIDFDPLIANLILRYYCQVGDCAAAYKYFQRMIEREQFPSVLGLCAYSRLLEQILEMFRDSNSDTEALLISAGRGMTGAANTVGTASTTSATSALSTAAGAPSADSAAKAANEGLLAGYESKAALKLSVAEAELHLAAQLQKQQWLPLKNTDHHYGRPYSRSR